MLEGVVIRNNEKNRSNHFNTVKPVLETTCIKRPPALRDHCSDTTTLLKAI